MWKKELLQHRYVNRIIGRKSEIQEDQFRNQSETIEPADDDRTTLSRHLFSVLMPLQRPCNVTLTSCTRLRKMLVEETTGINKMELSNTVHPNKNVGP